MGDRKAQGGLKSEVFGHGFFDNDSAASFAVPIWRTIAALTKLCRCRARALARIAATKPAAMTA
jgi:hypothetical protein